MKRILTILMAAILLPAIAGSPLYAQFGSLKKKLPDVKKPSDLAPDKLLEEKRKEYNDYFSQKGFFYNNFIPTTYSPGMFLSPNKGKEYLDATKEFNPGEVKSKLADAKKYDPLTFNNDNLNVKRVESIFNDFPGFAGDFLKKEVNRLIEEAYKLKDKKTLKAVQMTDNAVYVCDAVLTLLPDNKDFPQMKKEAQDANKAMNDKLASMFTSDFHKNNVNRIVFSNSPVAVKKEDPAQLKGSFKAGEIVQGMAYFNGTLGEIFGDRIWVIVVVDGNSVFEESFSLKDEELGNSFTDVLVVPNPDTYKGTGGAYRILGRLKDLSPKTHKVEYLYATSRMAKDKVAGGEFEFDMSGDGPDKLKKMYETIEAKNLDAVRMPKAKMKNAQLEKDFLQAIKDEGWKEKPLRAVIGESDWNIVKHEWTGLILYRDIVGYVAVEYAPGKCRYFEISVEQDYTGSGYGKSRYGGVGYSEDIGCENVNK
ncbi:MAG: hypothetical protein FJ088_01715 [Deltaproteobacteria bacterium]|nr:hypothetical protein [Deltaproteobacteria bacterium]